MVTSRRTACRCPPGGVSRVRARRDDSWFNGVPPLARGCADGDELIGGRPQLAPDRDRRPLPRSPVPARCAERRVDQRRPGAADDLAQRQRDHEPARRRSRCMISWPRWRGSNRTAPKQRWYCLRMASRFVVCTVASKACGRITCEQLDLLREACREPRAAYDCVPVMFGRVLRGFHVFLALGETLAHLHYLWHDGEMQRELGADGIYRFAMAEVTNDGHVAGNVLVGPGRRGRGCRAGDRHVLPADARARSRGGRDRGAPRVAAVQPDRRVRDRRRRRDRCLALAPFAPAGRACCRRRIAT